MPQKTVSQSLPVANGPRRSSGRPTAGDGTVGREMLIEKTCELLRQLPLRKVTREAVAKHANVHPSLIKYYFRDRQSLIVAAVEKVMSQVRIATEAAAAQADAALVDVLTARVKQHLYMQVENPSLHRIIVDEVLSSDLPVYAEQVKTMSDRALGSYSWILSEGAERRELRAVDPLFLYFAVVGMCEFFVAAEPIIKEIKGADSNAALLKGDYHAFIMDLMLNGLLPRA